MRTGPSELPRAFPGASPIRGSARTLSAGLFFSTGFRRALHPAGPSTTSSRGLALTPFAGGISSLGLEPALARLAPEDTGGLFLPARGDVAAHEVVPAFRGAGSSVLAGGLRAWGDATCVSLAGGLAWGPSVLVWDCRAGEGLPGGQAPVSPSLGRAFRRQLSACSLLLSPEGASAGVGALPARPGLGVAPGVWKNLSRACCILETDGVESGVFAGLGDAGRTPALLWGAATWEVTRPCGVAGRESAALGVRAGRGLTAAASWTGGDHPAGELLATCRLALPPWRPAENLGPAGLPVRTWEAAAAGGSPGMGTPLAVELPTTGSRADGLALGPVSRSPFAPRAFPRALLGLESEGTAPGRRGARNVGLADAASGWWLEHMKTPGSPVGL